MSPFLRFILVGSATALIVEASFNLLAVGTYGNFVFTIFAYPAYLAAFYAPQTFVLRRLVRSARGLFIATYVAGGILGLAIEWFVIGNSPWGNPEAIQWGMWAFWTAVVALPTLYLADPSAARKMLMRLLIVYGGISIALAIVVPAPLHVAALVLWQTAYYTYLHLPYVLYIRRPSAR